VERKASEVGDRIEAHAVVAKRKVSNFWHWLFGGDDDQSRPHETDARSNFPGEQSENTARLEAKSQPYVGSKN
jgi:hypothetical protein